MIIDIMKHFFLLDNRNRTTSNFFGIFVQTMIDNFLFIFSEHENPEDTPHLPRVMPAKYVS